MDYAISDKPRETQGRGYDFFMEGGGYGTTLYDF